MLFSSTSYAAEDCSYTDFGQKLDLKFESFELISEVHFEEYLVSLAKVRIEHTNEVLSSKDEEGYLDRLLSLHDEVESNPPRCIYKNKEPGDRFWNFEIKSDAHPREGVVLMRGEIPVAYIYTRIISI